MVDEMTRGTYEKSVDWKIFKFVKIKFRKDFDDAETFIEQYVEGKMAQRRKQEIE